MKDTRPFSLADAKAGAPYACRDGGNVEVLTWDAGLPGDCNIVGISHAEVIRWSEKGSPAAAWPTSYELVMLPLGEIDGKPVFTGDEIELRGFDGLNGENWRRITVQPDTLVKACCEVGYARWPAPAKQYPFSQMSEQELLNAAGSAMPLDWANGFLRVAHAAIRHAIDREQVITTEQHQQKIDDITQSLQFTGFPINNWQENIDGFGIIKGGKEVVQAVKKSIDSRAARDMAIARAVAKEVAPDLAILEGYLAAIIEGVK